MVQSAESWHEDDLVCVRRGQRCSSASGHVLPQSKMSPVFVTVVDVVFQQSSQVPLVQNDHVVEQIPTHTSDPTLGDAVLPGTSKSRSDRFCAVLFDGRDDVSRELGIAESVTITPDFGSYGVAQVIRKTSKVASSRKFPPQKAVTCCIMAR